MFYSIPVTDLDGRPMIEIPNPQLIVDSDGNPILKNNRRQFTVKADRMDYMMVRQSPIRVAFSERFIIHPDHRVKMTELAVFFFLANITEWSDIEIVVGGDNKPIKSSAGKAQAIITTYGNRSRTKTVQEIADAVGASYGAVQKALSFWEGVSVMRRISEYRRKAPRATERDAGRPVDHRRYEFDPQYVWNGHIWIGNGYSDFLQGRIEVVS